MKLSLFLGCVLLSILVAASGHTFDSRLDEDWKIWKSQHEKQYTEEEETHRRSIWEDNVRYIEQHNQEYSMGKHTFTVGMNEFGDLTDKEFNERMNGFLPIKPDNSTEKVDGDELEDVESDGGDDELEDVENDRVDDKFNEDEGSDDDVTRLAIDWRRKGCVTPVKNQGSCGSCWAFSAVGAIEAQWYRKTGNLIPLSEQNLVDCTRPYGNHGCQGGWMSYAFNYVLRNKGINADQDYPYTGQDYQTCNFQKAKVAARIRGYRHVQRCKQCLANAVRRIGPISVAVDAGGPFRWYKQGIYRNPNCNSHGVNHAVLVVGYESQGRSSFWLVKNSWGTDWGDQGYIKMAMGVQRNCGITRHAVYPIV